jgi:hypothetical protein
MIWTMQQLKQLKKEDLIELFLDLQSQGTNSSPKISAKKETKVISEFLWNGSQGKKIVEISGKKFSIVYDNTNGFPLGFNYKFSASVMKDDGTWNYVAEKKDIVYSECSYVSNESERKEDAKKFIEEMIKYLEKIY